MDKGERVSCGTRPNCVRCHIRNGYKRVRLPLANLAQRAEHALRERGVAGSVPAGGCAHSRWSVSEMRVLWHPRGNNGARGLTGGKTTFSAQSLTILPFRNPDAICTGNGHVFGPFVPPFAMFGVLSTFPPLARKGGTRILLRSVVRVAKTTTFYT